MTDHRQAGPLRANAPEPEDPGHLLPEREWLAVVAGAEQRARVLAERPDPARRGLVDRTITARSHGGIMPGGPRLGVIHSAETPLRAGYAYSIAANWFATKATTSATVMIDPAETVRLLPDNVVSYAVGPVANGFTVNVEQAGMASLLRAGWTTLDGLAQMERVAAYMRDCERLWKMPLRWATDDQIRAARAGGAPQGWCEHDDIRRVLGGTTHTDPGPNYPRDLLMATAIGAPDTPEEIDVDAVVLVGVKDADPAWGGWWAVNLATFTRWRVRSFPQMELWKQAGVKSHGDQSREMLAGLVLVGEL